MLFRSITGKGSLITGTAIATPASLTVGADNSVLVACSACPTGLVWASASAVALTCCNITGKGSLITGTALATPASLSAGADNSVLVACSACPTGLVWATPSTVGTGHLYFANSLGFSAAWTCNFYNWEIGRAHV